MESPLVSSPGKSACKLKVDHENLSSISNVTPAAQIKVKLNQDSTPLASSSMYKRISCGLSRNSGKISKKKLNFIPKTRSDLGHKSSQESQSTQEEPKKSVDNSQQSSSSSSSSVSIESTKLETKIHSNISVSSLKSKTSEPDLNHILVNPCSSKDSLTPTMLIASKLVTKKSSEEHRSVEEVSEIESKEEEITEEDMEKLKQEIENMKLELEGQKNYDKQIKELKQLIQQWKQAGIDGLEILSVQTDPPMSFDAILKHFNIPPEIYFSEEGWQNPDS